MPKPITQTYVVDAIGPCRICNKVHIIAHLDEGEPAQLPKMERIARTDEERMVQRGTQAVLQFGPQTMSNGECVGVGLQPKCNCNIREFAVSFEDFEAMGRPNYKDTFTVVITLGAVVTDAGQ